MGSGSFQKKLLLRASSPSEYLHTLTAHWILILGTTGLGTLVLFTVLTSQPTLYQARAILQLNPNELLVEPGTRPVAVRTDLVNFINDQVGILQSQTVLQSLVGSLGYHRASPDREAERQPGRLQAVYRDLEQRLESFISELGDPVRGSPEEMALQRAVRQFRNRSQVLTQQDSLQVRLVVVGPDPGSLVTELEAWITAYRRRIEDFTEESAKRFLEERKDAWGGIVRQKGEALESFRKRNPEVSETMHRFLQGQIIRQEYFLDSLRTRMTGLTVELEGSPETGLPLAQVEQGLSDIFRRKKEELELQRVDLLGQYPETSELIKAHDAKIQEVERSIQSGGSSPLHVAGPDRRKAMVETLQKNVEFAGKELERLQLQLVEVDGKMVEFRKLQADLQYAEDKVRSYERSMDWKMESTEGQKLVQVQVWDKPAASTSPINSFKALEAGYGALGGLVAGFLLAFFREFFRKTIRFKRDVVEELGLEVIGVIPRR